MKVIGPLFMDELRAEFARIKANQNALFAFHKRLATLHFLDPACGCGNFLVVTYRELRRLERDVLAAAAQFGQATGSVFKALTVNVDQFHGIELEEFPAQVAQVAMWLADHQMNLEAGRDFGEYFSRIPLTKSANVRCGNALKLDWEAFVPPSKLSYILGNPPFLGKKEQSVEQKADLEAITHGIKGAGVLDYVCGWHLKAAHYLSGVPIGALGRDKRQFVDAAFASASPASAGEVARSDGGVAASIDPARSSASRRNPSAASAASPLLAQGRPKRAVRDTGIEDLFVTADKADELSRQKIRCAFVSTNSICQGEQVGVLWSELLRLGMKIQFAHRTFKWSNEAPGKAAVHCIIVGFGREVAEPPRLFDYAQVDGLPLEQTVGNINPYLVDAPDVVLASRRAPLSDLPQMMEGSALIDEGHLLLTRSERDVLLSEYPIAAKWIRPFVWGEGFINNHERWCLWLEGADAGELQRSGFVMQRIAAVKAFRLSSDRAATKKLAGFPTLFGETRQPKTDWLMVPKTSSERRSYIPIGFLSADHVVNNTSLFVGNAKPCHFGLLTSAMHMAWVRYVCGRLKSDFRYSAQIVYNNFPWPQALSDAQREAIETKAQAVLAARAEHVGATLAALYDPLTMPPNLLKAHQALDRAVDTAYVADGGPKTYANDAERVAFLFKRYAALTSLV